MARRISGAALKIRSLHPDPQSGGVLPILCPTSADLWASFVGAMAADLVPANLPLPTFKTHLPTYLRNLQSLMDRYETNVVVGSQDVRNRLSSVLPRTVRWIDIADIQGEADPAEVRDGRSPIAFLQHSSGSTGVPKGVAISHRAALDHLDAYARALELDARRDSIASWLPLYHDMGLVTSFLLPLALGVSCRSTTPETFILNPLAFLADMAEARATHAWWPNFAFALLADRHHAAVAQGNRPTLDLSSARALTNCSEVVMASSMNRFVSAFEAEGLRTVALQASYAMAENVFAVTQTAATGPARVEVDPANLQPGLSPIRTPDRASAIRELVSSGRPIEGVEVKVVDTAGEVIADGIVGEIALGGPFLFMEYLRLPTETLASRIDGWYFTRDLGFLWKGELYVLGRDTDLIVVGGRKFLPNEVERIAGEIEGVKPGRVVAFGVTSELKGTEEAVAVVESADASDPSRVRIIRRAIIQSVLQQMDLGLVDVRVVAEGHLIKTSSGKIARNDNRRVFLESDAEPKP